MKTKLNLMKTLFAAVVAASCVGLAGCVGKTEPAAAAPSGSSGGGALPSLLATPDQPAVASSQTGGAGTVASQQTTASAPAAPAPAFEAAVDPQVNELQEAVYKYAQGMNQKPASLEQLVSARFLAALPVAPKGRKYIIDRDTLEVKSVAQ
jgi:hypothetical protein